MNTKISEVAVAWWRIDKWLENTDVERKMAVKSSLRTIKSFLHDNDIEVIDLTGQVYESGLAVEVLNDIDSIPDENAIIKEMISPIILQSGSVIEFGKVFLTEQKRDTEKVNNKENLSKPQKKKKVTNVKSKTKKVTKKQGGSLK